MLANMCRMLIQLPIDIKIVIVTCLNCCNRFYFCFFNEKTLIYLIWNISKSLFSLKWYVVVIKAHFDSGKINEWLIDFFFGMTKDGISSDFFDIRWPLNPPNRSMILVDFVTLNDEIHQNLQGAGFTFCSFTQFARKKEDPIGKPSTRQDWRCQHTFFQRKMIDIAYRRSHLPNP